MVNLGIVEHRIFGDETFLDGDIFDLFAVDAPAIIITLIGKAVDAHIASINGSSTRPGTKMLLAPALS